MKIWFLITGYIVFFAYTVGIMTLGAVIEKKTNVNKTVCRKIVHVISSFVWIICKYFFGCTLHWVILNGVGTLALVFVTFSGKLKVFGRDDAKNSVGLFYFGLSTFIVALVCYFINKDFYLYTGIAYYCLSLGDGFAPIVAAIFKKGNVTLRKGKTLFGTLSVYIVSFLATLVFSLIFKMNLSVTFILSVAALTCVVEFYGFKGLDNIFIEFFVFGYLVLYYYGLVSLPLQIVLIVSPFLAIFAIGSKAMTYSGGVFALIVFTLIGFFGKGFLPTVFIFVLFALSSAVTLTKKFLFSDKTYDKTPDKTVRKPSEARGAKQIIAVGFFGIVFLIAYYYSGVKLFYHLFFLSLVEQFADTLASDIGRMTKGKTLNVITFKPIEKGISGGVSLLGTVSAALGSLVLTLLPLLFNAISLKIYLFISLFAFLGTLFDSLLGALFQSLYQCEKCGKLTEKPLHCDNKATLVKGFKVIDNVAVNYLAGFLTCVLGCLLYLF